MRWLPLAVVLGGCAGDGTPAGEPPPEVRPAPTTLPAATPEPRVTVRVVSPGAEPRSALRFAPRAGAEHVLALEMAIAMTMSSGGHKMFGQDAVTHGKLALRVAGVDASGTSTHELTVVELDAPRFGPVAGSSVHVPVGARGTFTVSDRGALVTASLPFLETYEDPGGIFYLSDSLVALPAEPVGVGAVWEVTSTSLRNGLTVRVVETHTLVAFDGARGRITYQQVQTTAPQLVPAFARDPLSMFEMVATTSSGAGELELALDRPYPITNAMRFSFESAMRMHRPDATQDVTMTMTAEFRARSE